MKQHSCGAGYHAIHLRQHHVCRTEHQGECRQVCGYDGEIKIVEDDGKLVWECPNCGNRDEKRMNVCRRVCGYLGANCFNQGRTQEIAERVLHL